jgi:uncharacterized protein (TIRG00374 family)
MKKMKKYNYLLGYLIGGFFLWLVAKNLDSEMFVDAVRAADPGLIAFACVVTIAACLIRTARWKLLFSFASHVPYSSLLSVIMIGFLANNLLPARLGEVTMAFLIHKKEGVGKSRAVGAIFLDRLFDVFALVTLALVTLIGTEMPAWVQWISGVAITGCFAAAAGVAWLSVRHQHRSRMLMQGLLRFLPARLSERLMQLFVMFLEGIAVITDPVRIVTVYLVSLVVWSGLATGVYALSLAFGFELGYAACVAVMAIVNLGLIIPSSPGFIGTFQFFCVAALGLFGIDQSSALSFSVVYHLSQWLPTTLLGYYFLNKENIKFFKLSGLRTATPNAPTHDVVRSDAT